MIFKRNKKGSIDDFITILVFLFTISIIILIAFKVTSSFNDEVQTKSEFPAKSKSASQGITNLYSGAIDNSFLFLVIGLSLSSFVLAALVRIHPVFFVFFLIIWLVIIVLAGVFSNAFQSIAANPDMVDVAAQLTFINFVMVRLPFIVGVLGSGLAIIMYKTWKLEQE